MAPSPTGYAHVGNVRTALFNWLFTRHVGGRFVVRIEDTDVERHVEAAVENVLEGFRWLGLDWDEGPDVGGPYGPYRQSQRLDLYREYAQRLLGEGKAYRCYCTPEELEAERQTQQARHEAPRYSRRCLRLTEAERRQLEVEGRPAALRFLVPPEVVTFEDLVRGPIQEDASLFSDFIILRSDGRAMYNFAVVVDDHLMQFTHVLRGPEHIPNTPRQVLLYRALGWPLPAFGHFSLLTNPDGTKLGKRTGALSLEEYRQLGYLPEAMVNFLALLGWSPPDEQEVLALPELVQKFSLDRVGRSPAKFDLKKLDWLNGVWIRSLPTDVLAHMVAPVLAGAGLLSGGPDERALLQAALGLEQERLKRLADAPQLMGFFFHGQLEYDPQLLVVHRRTAGETADALARVEATLRAVNRWESDLLEPATRALADELGWKHGDLFMSIRVAITGSTATPPLFATMGVLGRERVLARIAAATRVLQRMGEAAVR